MRRIVSIAPDDIAPEQDEPLVLQGLKAGTKPSAAVLDLYHDALALFLACVRPAGVFADISKDEFERVYRGEGRNETRTPVQEIFPRAERLALFAVTVGQKVHDRINGLFDASDFALASMLDSVASAGVERAADLLEARFEAAGMTREAKGRPLVTMRYSPGYCGWHVSGQKQLFAFLKPDDIGIALRESSLMEPLKSASGVFIEAMPEVHVFDDTFPMCGSCEDHSCRDRIAQKMARLKMRVP